VELGFNLAWVILSLLLSIGWARNASKSPGHHAHRASFLALVILIALLFPVVSISDDLHENQGSLVSEEIRYLEDLHHHFEAARLHSDHNPISIDLAVAVTAPAFEITHFEEVVGHGTLLMRVHASFRPALHDLPPPAWV
jgi:hypothetical protein